MKSLLENGPKHCVGSPPSSGSVLMRSDYGPVDDGADVVVFELQFLEDELPDASLRPVREAVVDRLPRAKSLWQVAPRNSRARAVENRVDKKSIAPFRARSLPLLRQYSSEPCPLLIAQCMSVHRQLGSQPAIRAQIFSRN